MNSTPVAERVRISFFGKRNVGKSSLINALTNQNLSIVSATPGTTTDPVSKTMELLPLGAVVLTDTAGIDDFGDLGQLRIKKSLEVLNKTDIAVIVCDVNDKTFDKELELIDKIKSMNIPYVLVFNKADDDNYDLSFDLSDVKLKAFTSVVNKKGINELKEIIGRIDVAGKETSILHGLIEKDDVVILVTPIDESAPKNRMIMPELMGIRDVLDYHAICVCIQVSELEDTLKLLNRTPKLVVTDSQAFTEVNNILPKSMPLTSFSMLMARYKGDLDEFVEGAKVLDNLKDGDKILISEACTHHVQKNDIGSVQIPKKLSAYTNKELIFERISGNSFPDDLSDYSLVIHCGGCMITKKMMTYRQEFTNKNNVPMTNYGVLLAKLTGILDRAIESTK